LVKNLLGLRSSILNRRRDERVRIAGYFDAIAKTLLEAADEFESKGRPWDTYRQIQVHFANFIDTVGDTLPRHDQTVHLCDELGRALRHDELLLGGTRERTILDAITVRPRDAVIVACSWRDNPVKILTDQEVLEAVKRETAKIREIAGTFKGFAVELLARPS
jgi:hypothetical protein